MNNHVSNYYLGKDSVVSVYRSQQESYEASHINTTYCSLQKNSRLSDFFVSVGSKLARNECHVDFKAEHAECDFKGINLANNNQHMDNYLPFTHGAPHCNSNQLYHAVLLDKARSSFYGKIIVPSNATKTDSHQLNKVLLLSDTAQADSRPELEIDTDDVKCHHGSAIGEIDKNALYYIMARGIDRNTAISIMVKAFVDSLFEDIKNANIENYVHDVVNNWLGKYVKL